MSGQFDAYTAALPLGKRLHWPLNKRLREPLGRSARFGKKKCKTRSMFRVLIPVSEFVVNTLIYE